MAAGARALGSSLVAGLALATVLGPAAATSLGAPGADVTVTSAGTAPVIASASVCCSATSFLVSNASDGGEQITSISIDLADATLPDLVFDPDDGSPAGDGLAFGFSEGELPAGGTATASFPAASAEADGFRRLDIATTGFPQAANLRFGVDVDPTSVKGAPATGGSESSAGAIAGAELHGARVSVSFSDGSTLASELVGDLDSTNAAARLRPAVPAEPTLTLANGATGPGAVSGTTQKVTLKGPPGALGQLAIFEGALDLSGGPGFDIDPFELNTLRARTVVSLTFDATGVATRTVSLGDVGGENGGINVITAWLRDGTIDGPVAGPIVLQLDPDAPTSLGPPGADPAPEVPGIENCSGFVLARASTASTGTVDLSARQLLINQRIGQTAIRRLNAVEAWLNDGIYGSDICGGSLTEAAIGASLTPGEAPLWVSRAEPRVPRIARRDAGGGAVTLTTGQLRINQRIYRAALLRAAALEKRLKNLTGGDVVDGSIDLGRFTTDVRVAPGVAAEEMPASTTRVAALTSTGERFRLTAGQLRTNQRIAQRAVRDANALIAKLRRGLLGVNFVPGSISARDLAVPDFRSTSP